MSAVVLLGIGLISIFVGTRRGALERTNAGRRAAGLREQGRGAQIMFALVGVAMCVLGLVELFG